MERHAGLINGSPKNEKTKIFRKAINQIQATHSFMCLCAIFGSFLYDGEVCA